MFFLNFYIVCCSPDPVHMFVHSTVCLYIRLIFSLCIFWFLQFLTIAFSAKVSSLEKSIQNKEQLQKLNAKNGNFVKTYLPRTVSSVNVYFVHFPIFAVEHRCEISITEQTNYTKSNGEQKWCGASYVRPRSTFKRIYSNLMLFIVFEFKILKDGIFIICCSRRWTTYEYINVKICMDLERYVMVSVYLHNMNAILKCIFLLFWKIIHHPLIENWLYFLRFRHFLGKSRLFLMLCFLCVRF